MRKDVDPVPILARTRQRGSMRECQAVAMGESNEQSRLPGAGEQRYTEAKLATWCLAKIGADMVPMTDINRARRAELEQRLSLQVED